MESCFRPSPKASGVKVGDLEFGDVDDFEDDVNDVQLQPTAVRAPPRQKNKQLDSKPIDTHTAVVSVPTGVTLSLAQVYLLLRR
jgi:hypothetical protein